MPRPGFVYILASRPNGTVYVGSTTDLAQRLDQHRRGEGSAFVAQHGVTRLVYVEPHAAIRDAVERERRIKKWNREWKVRLIREQNPTWADLADGPDRQPGEGGAVGSRRMDPRLRGDDSVGRGETRRDRGTSPRALLSVALAALALALGACGDEAPESQLANDGPESLVALAVEVDAPEDDDSLGVARSTFQVDGAGAAWYDALAAPGRDPAMGLTVGDRTVLHGWQWWSDADSVVLGPAERIRGIARPDVTIRSYMERDTTGILGRIIAQFQDERPSRLSERVTLLDGTGDGQAALLVEVADPVGTVAFRPVRSDRRAAGEYRAQDVGGVLVFAAAADVPTDSTVVPEGPIWTAVAGAATRSTSAASTTPEAGRDAAFTLGEVAIETPGALAVATGATPEAAAAAARAALAAGDARRQSRSERLAAVVDAVTFETEDETMNDAYRWAVVGLEALTVRDSSRATLLPGLPGAEPETYPSVAWTLGAFLSTGRWEEARALLTTLGDAQLFDRRIDLLGRAPDLVRLGGEDDVFTTATGTPEFLGAAGDYVRVTGDRGLVSGGPNFWFKTVFALRGIYEPDSRNNSAMDSLGHFLARDNRGTWLEGDPERGGVERRGAVAEGQGALYRSLQTATQFARIMGVSQRSSATWYADTAAVLVRQFEREFTSGDLVRDRLGAGDLRPGGLIALSQIDGLPARDRARLARAMAERLVFPYGVASLAQSDSMFHPYLEAPAFYTPEAARTNGAVFTWLAGPVAELMAETGGGAAAAELVSNQARLLLDTGLVGAVPELVAGHPRAPGETPEVGGAPVNPWSLASFLDATVRGVVGATYRSPDTLVVRPNVPDEWGETTTAMRLGEGSVGLTIEPSADGARVRVTPGAGLAATAAVVVEGGGRRVTVPLVRAQGDTLAVPLDAFEVVVTASGAQVDGSEVPSASVASAAAVWDGFAFAEPDLRDEYPVMRAVESQRSLGDAQILRDNPRAAVKVTQNDPQNDDWGATSTFTYPEGVPEGTLDVTYFEVATDDSTTYFRTEFAELAEGQTIVAFAIDTEEGGAETVGRGADYDFPDDGGYEFVVFVGDGIVVEDAAGREVGRLSAGGAAFDAQAGTLQFALPTFVVPTLGRRARITMLVGARGPGGDVGTFRRVERDASEDVGGGRVDSRSPNVYDVVVGTLR